MENKEFKFKTTLDCGGCVSKVQGDLDSASGIEKWNVDTSNPDKILTVESSGITEKEVMDIVKAKGFEVESIS
ncbi:heavy-metal-associated domain-containing protein [Chryseobacterium sp. A301]